MDILVADAVTIAAAKGLGVAKFLLRSCASSTHLSITDSYADQSAYSSSAAGVLQVSAVLFPVDVVAPPPVKSNPYRIRRRTLLRRKRRTKRKLSGGDDFGDAGNEGFFFDDGGDVAFGGGGGYSCGFGGSGGSWNFNRFGEGHDWDDSSSSYSDPAFDFVYEVLSWIVLSNCLHFSLKKIFRIVVHGIVDAESEKVPRRLEPIC